MTYPNRQPITSANYQAAMAASAGQAIVSNVNANPRIVTVESMTDYLRSNPGCTQDDLDRDFTKSEQRLFPAARERAIRLSSDAH